ncbi:PEP-dependent dihydroxyacetone kinase, ADP-binding subunit DhaL [subsurface metagenome]
MEYFLNSEGGIIVNALTKTIKDNRGYLSDIDGIIGDGDHGININKGFIIYEVKIGDRKLDLMTALKMIGEVLLIEIGGSVGPLYGTFFMNMSGACSGKEKIDKKVFFKMLKAAIDGVQRLGNARVGDKTMVDTLAPAIEAYGKALKEGRSFVKALKGLKEAAENGKNSTIDMVAKIGRASRLGKRSRGVLDAGAVSCNLILQTMADAIINLLDV